MLHHVAPVRSDIGESAGWAGLDAPVPIGVVEQPILRIGSLHHLNVAQFASLADAPHVLHLRVIAQVMECAIGETPLFRQPDHFARLGNRCRERFLAENVFTGFERCRGHGEME